ncbi:unnamed protein product [Brassica rapa]|uniref:TauD/TfdA-like domain-containing protein n=1 Tax=Brassica campestris TaxID=3711 RepID=A0A8D9GI30_BRACM|nr:unnamed protein product [Brassica rapa]
MPPKLKPQRLHQIAETDAEQLVKKARTMTTESSMKDAFFLYADYLNNFRERERVVKVSRDITMNSKKVIFQVHSKDNKEEVLEKAGKDLEAVREQHFSRLMKELQGTDFWKLRRAYSPGVCQRIITNHSSFKSTVNDGAAVAAAAIAGRYGIHSWQAFKARPIVPRMRKFDEERQGGELKGVDMLLLDAKLNESPPDQKIPFHHEMAQVPEFPSKLFFYCEVEPNSGGETPLVLSHVVYERMKEKHPEFVRGWRNMVWSTSGFR